MQGWPKFLLPNPNHKKKPRSSTFGSLLSHFWLFQVYHHLALWLTNKENPRTQTEYENSYTFKIFLFEFMNFYSSLIYIAFFKVHLILHWYY